MQRVDAFEHLSDEARRNLKRRQNDDDRYLHALAQAAEDFSKVFDDLGYAPLRRNGDYEWRTARGEPLNEGEQRDLAKRLGGDPDQLLARRVGEKWEAQLNGGIEEEKSEVCSPSESGSKFASACNCTCSGSPRAEGYGKWSQTDQARTFVLFDANTCTSRRIDLVCDCSANFVCVTIGVCGARQCRQYHRAKWKKLRSCKRVLSLQEHAERQINAKCAQSLQKSIECLQSHGSESESEALEFVSRELGREVERLTHVTRQEAEKLHERIVSLSRR